jgi:hypothetical protein
MELLPIVRKRQKERSVHTNALMLTNIASTPESATRKLGLVVISIRFSPV